jgi:hypothetical protein
MTSDYSATITYIMWHEERRRNISVLQGVQFSIPKQS